MGEQGPQTVVAFAETGFIREEGDASTEIIIIYMITVMSFYQKDSRHPISSGLYSN